MPVTLNGNGKHLPDGHPVKAAARPVPRRSKPEPESSLAAVLEDSAFIDEAARKAVGDVSRTVTLAELLGPAGEEAHEACKDEPVIGLAPTFAEPSKPAPDFLADYRSLAKLLAFLQHDTPERRAVLKAIGLDADAISPRQAAVLAKDLLKEVDRFHAEEKLTSMPWETFRDTLPVVAGINTRRLSDVVEREVDWLWAQRIPLGKLTIISGDPDLGKTWLILDLIARITTGREMPDGSPNPFGGERRDALWASSEDEDEDTILGRVKMLGGDPSRVHSLQFVLDEGKQRTLRLDQHQERLDQWLALHPLVAVAALDPLAAFVGKINSHNDAEVRGLLTPLSKIANNRRVAILGNNHLNKNAEGGTAIYRSMGSIGFVAAARSAWLVTRDSDEPKDRRLFLKVKNNLASEDKPNLAFRVGKAHNGISWEKEEVTATADEALTTLTPSSAPKREEAKEWITNLLKDGPVASEEVETKAKSDGLNRATLFAAKKELGVTSEKTGGSGAGWAWALPKAKPLDG